MNGISEIKKQIEDHNLQDGTYCIIAYELKPLGFNRPGTRKIVRFVYKNFNDFQERVEADTKNINEDNGIYFEWRTFD